MTLTASLSGNSVGYVCSRISAMACGEWSGRVRWCLSPSPVIVTQLVTQLLTASALATWLQTNRTAMFGTKERSLT